MYLIFFSEILLRYPMVRMCYTPAAINRNHLSDMLIYFPPIHMLQGRSESSFFEKSATFHHGWANSNSHQFLHILTNTILLSCWGGEAGCCSRCHVVQPWTPDPPKCRTTGVCHHTWFTHLLEIEPRVSHVL